MKVMEIKYNELKIYLESLKLKDFENGTIEKGTAIDDIEKFKMDKSKIKLSEVIFKGDPFLVDVIGNDLSVVFLTEKRYRLHTGRVAQCKFDRTIILDCNKIYGSCLNGYWKIPDEFLIEEGENYER